MRINTKIEWADLEAECQKLNPDYQAVKVTDELDKEVGNFSHYFYLAHEPLYTV